MLMGPVLPWLVMLTVGSTTDLFASYSLSKREMRLQIREDGSALLEVYDTITRLDPSRPARLSYRFPYSGTLFDVTVLFQGGGPGEWVNTNNGTPDDARKILNIYERSLVDAKAPRPTEGWKYDTDTTHLRDAAVVVTGVDGELQVDIVGEARRKDIQVGFNFLVPYKSLSDPESRFSGIKGKVWRYPVPAQGASGELLTTLVVETIGTDSFNRSPFKVSSVPDRARNSRAHYVDLFPKVNMPHLIFSRAERSCVDLLHFSLDLPPWSMPTEPGIVVVLDVDRTNATIAQAIFKNINEVKPKYAQFGVFEVVVAGKKPTIHEWYRDDFQPPAQRGDLGAAISQARRILTKVQRPEASRLVLVTDRASSNLHSLLRKQPGPPAVHVVEIVPNLRVSDTAMQKSIGAIPVDGTELSRTGGVWLQLPADAKPDERLARHLIAPGVVQALRLMIDGRPLAEDHDALLAITDADDNVRDHLPAHLEMGSGIRGIIALPATKSTRTSALSVAGRMWGKDFSWAFSDQGRDHGAALEAATSRLFARLSPEQRDCLSFSSARVVSKSNARAFVPAPIPPGRARPGPVLRR
jgi:hypothetical protein